MSIRSKIKEYNFTTLALLLAGLFLFLYVVARAWLVPMTWDERFTLNEYILKNQVFPVKYEMMSGNNHLLNTWLIWLLSKAFGTGLFVMRLPNVIAYVFFLFLTAKIVRQIKPGALQVMAFLIVNLNPFMIDFFSLARGYGISLSLFIASIYYLFKSFYDEKENYKHAWLFACIALLANMTLFYYSIALLCIILINKFFFREKLNFNTYKTIILITTIILGFVIYHGIKLDASGSLYYGGHDGFWYNTVNSLVYKSLYDMQYSDFVQVPAKLLLLGVLATAAFAALRKNILERKNNFLSILLFLLFFMTLLIVLANKIFGVAFLIERTAIYFLPLFSFILIFTFYYLTSLIKERYVLFFGFFVALCFMVHFFYCINFSYALDWKT